MFDVLLFDGVLYSINTMSLAILIRLPTQNVLGNSRGELVTHIAEKGYWNVLKVKIGIVKSEILSEVKVLVKI